MRHLSPKGILNVDLSYLPKGAGSYFLTSIKKLLNLLLKLSYLDSNFKLTLGYLNQL